MGRMSARARQFVESYAADHLKFDAAAREAQDYIAGLLAPHVIPIHAVIGRSKTVTSLRGKIRRKNYLNPATEVTDLVGVRVITYFGRNTSTLSRRNCEQALISAYGSHATLDVILARRSSVTAPYI